MSKLAGKLSTVRPTTTERIRKGPQGACQGKYPADLDDWREVERLRAEGASWAEVQRLVDDVHGVTDRIHSDKFRYHWRRKCWCWSDEDRL